MSRFDGRQVNPQDKHTIVLLQLDNDESRTYNEYDSTKDAVEGLCSIFEQNKKMAEYNVSDVVDYFKSFEEIMFLEYDDRLSQYTPRDADWISQAIARYAGSMV